MARFPKPEAEIVAFNPDHRGSGLTKYRVNLR